MSFSPVRLNHAVLFVADLDRAERFYTEVFGMVVAAREPLANAAFLRLPRSGNHHDLGLFGVGTAAAPKVRGGIGLYHLAWQLDTIDELAEARQTLIDVGGYTGESSHAPRRACTGSTPTATSSRSCGCCPATPGASPRTRPRLNGSTSPRSSSVGPACPPPVASSRMVDRGSRRELEAVACSTECSTPRNSTTEATQQIQLAAR